MLCKLLEVYFSEIMVKFEDAIELKSTESEEPIALMDVLVFI